MVNTKEYNKKYYQENKERIKQRRKQRYKERKENKEKMQTILKRKGEKRTKEKSKRKRKQATIKLNTPTEKVRQKEKALAEKIKGKKIDSYFEISTILRTNARNKLIIEYTSENEEGTTLKAKTTSNTLTRVKDLEILKRELATIIEEGEEITETEIQKILKRIEDETGFKGITLKTAKEKGAITIKKIRIQTNVERTKHWK